MTAYLHELRILAIGSIAVGILTILAMLAVAP